MNDTLFIIMTLYMICWLIALELIYIKTAMMIKDSKENSSWKKFRRNRMMCQEILDFQNNMRNSNNSVITVSCRESLDMMIGVVQNTIARVHDGSNYMYVDGNWKLLDKLSHVAKQEVDYPVTYYVERVCGMEISIFIKNTLTLRY